MTPASNRKEDDMSRTRSTIGSRGRSAPGKAADAAGRTRAVAPYRDGTLIRKD